MICMPETMPHAQFRSAWLLQGPGLATRVSVSAVDCSPEYQLETINQTRSGLQYDEATQIESGELIMAQTQTSGDFQRTIARGKLNFRFTGSRTQAEISPNWVQSTAHKVHNTAWMVTTASDHILVVLSHADMRGQAQGRCVTSAAVLEAIKNVTAGPCSLRSLTVGLFTTNCHAANPKGSPNRPYTA